MKRSKKSLLFLIAGFLIGLGIFSYPALSDYIARRNVIQNVSVYERSVNGLSEEEIQDMWAEAVAYNASLKGDPVPDPFIPASGRVLPDNYEKILDQGDSIMGFVDIPSISVYLPIRHGASQSVLAKGAGHIEQTPFPIGGSGNLSVITAHTGFLQAEMFDRLIEMKVGDTFMLHILDQTLTYQVDQIETILPEEVSKIYPIAGQDYVTLMTCTPYGINSHRLLVRGIRIANQEYEAAQVQTFVPWKLIVILSLGGVVLLVFIGWHLKKRQKV
ncbi:MAG: class C sortase [Lachnospiraceae bacterium]